MNEWKPMYYIDVQFESYFEPTDGDDTLSAASAVGLIAGLMGL